MKLDEILNYFTEKKNHIQQLRRELHQIPELGFNEVQTAAYIAEHLNTLGIDFESGIGITGIIARIGKPSENTIALRADMDALPIQEENSSEYQSKQPGIMHACGHDAHVAILLGITEYLKSIENKLNGQVLCVFQPSEERGDGDGISGARHILMSGKLKNTKMMLGLHVMSNLPAGNFGIISKGVMASGDMFNAVIRGRGGHDAWAHETIDPIFITTQVLNAIYGIRSRKIDPQAPCTLSIGTIQGGTSANVIPESVCISGTLRTFDPKVREILIAELERALKLSELFGGSYKLEIPIHQPVTWNDPNLADKVRQVCLKLFGEDCLVEIKPSLGVEDFSWYSKEMPALFVMLGAQLPGELRPHHNPRFDIDDSILYKGSALITASVLALLEEMEIDNQKVNDK